MSRMLANVTNVENTVCRVIRFDVYLNLPSKMINGIISGFRDEEVDRLLYEMELTTLPNHLRN